MSVVSDVEIRLRADIARLQQDMTAARRSVDTALDGMSASAQALKGLLSGLAAGLSVGAFVSFIKNSIDATDALNDMSVRTKVAIEDLAGLAYAAKLGDTSLEGVAASISKLGQNIGKDGEKFRALGITAKDPLEAFKQLADIFKDIEDPQQRAAFGAEALGKSWQEAAVLLDGGAAGITELMNRGKELSGVTEETAAAAGKFNDGLDTLGFAAQGVGTRIAAGLLPMLNVLVDDFTATGKGADTAAGSVVVLSGAFKALYTVGVIVIEMFATLGKAAGAAAAITMAALSGDFKGAVTIYKDLAADVADGWVDGAKKIANAWSATSASVAKEGEAASTTAAATAAKVAGFLNASEIKAARDKAAAEAEAAAKKERAAYAGVVTSIKEKMAADLLEINGASAITPVQQARIKLDAELATGKITLTAEHVKEAHALLDSAEAMEKNAAAAKQVRAAVAALADERAKNYADLVAEAAANEKLAATFGKTKKQIEQMTLAREEDRLAQRGALELSEDTVAQLEREIEARKRNVAALGSLEVLEAQKKASEEAAAAQKEFWKSIDDTAHSTFVSILNGSKDTATRLKDTFKNIFFDWLYQMTIKKWIINIGTSNTGIIDGIVSAFSSGSSGGAATSSGGSGLGGILGSASNLFSIGKTIYSGFSTGLVSSLGSSISSLGASLGSEAVAAFGAGMSGGALGATTASAASGYAGTAAASAGAGAAGAIPVIGWIITAMMTANGLYKQGWDATNGTLSETGKVLGSGILAFNSTLKKFGLSDSAANIFSGQATISKLFGRKNPEIESQGLRGTLTATGTTDAQNYVNILEKGGWFRSDKRYSQTGAASKETDTLIDSTMQAIITGVKSFGDAIGIETKNLDSYTRAFDLKLTGVADTDNAALAKLFADVGDELAVSLLPTLKDFQKENEALSVTLQRLATDYTTLDTMLASIGTTFGAVGAASLAGREGLIAAAGGMDKLAANVDYFQKNFLTAAEQLAPVQKQLADALKALGVAGLTTNDQFKTYLLGIDKTTAAGATLFTQLLALAPAFNEITKAAADAAEAASKAAAAAQLTEVNSLISAITSAYSDLTKVIDAQKSAAKSALDLLLQGIDASITAVTAKINSLTSLANALAAPITAVRTQQQGVASQGAARAQIQAALAIAKASGVLPSADSLKEALATLGRNTADSYGSMTDYLREQAAAGRDVKDLGAITDTQLSVAQRTLQSLNDQKTAAQRAYDLQIARLDALLEEQRKAVAIATGGAASLNSLPAALAALAEAIASLKGAAATNPLAAEAGNIGRIQDLYSTLLGRNADASGLQFYLDEIKNGTSWDSIKNGFLNSPEYLQGQNNNKATVDELRVLNARMESIEEHTMRTANSSSTTAGSTNKLANQFDQVSAGGSVLLTVPA